MPAPLSDFLRLISSGNTTLSPELYQAFGGDSILAELQKFDPNAKFSDVQGQATGGEQGGGPMEKRLDFDVSKLPKTKAGEFWEIGNSAARPLVNPNAVVNDDVYGSVTNSANYQKQNDPAWVKLAPLAVTLLAPYAGGALAAAGIGAAGGTAAVTGAAAGLNAVNIATGAGATVGGTTANALRQLPNMARGYGQTGKLNPLGMVQSLVAPAASEFGIDPVYVKGAMTLASIANMFRKP
jgi:hypothetical protein